MTRMRIVKAILTDAHFLIPAAVLCLGLALLIQLH
ncbi:translocated intimin receptor Tir [Terriglobus tenax]|nr:translocated intimin receptor Tir [Terriglobus tenax]